MSYTYKVRDHLGNLHDGEIEAKTEEEAQQILRADGFQVVELEEVDDGSGLFKKRVKRGELIYMTSQLSIMVDTGINISTALADLAEEEANPALKRIMEELRNRVENGDELSKALADHPHVFDQTYVALVRAAEQTGSLGEMLDRIAVYMRREMETFRGCAG